MSSSTSRKRAREAGSYLSRNVERMLHAFGDCPSPLPGAVALLEAHGLACARAILRRCAR